ncbi:unnamed protein product, partial [Urochloa humidicola]
GFRRSRRATSTTTDLGSSVFLLRPAAMGGDVAPAGWQGREQGSHLQWQPMAPGAGVVNGGEMEIHPVP